MFSCFYLRNAKTKARTDKKQLQNLFFIWLTEKTVRFECFFFCKNTNNIQYQEKKEKKMSQKVRYFLIYLYFCQLKSLPQRK